MFQYFCSPEKCWGVIQMDINPKILNTSRFKYLEIKAEILNFNVVCIFWSQTQTSLVDNKNKIIWLAVPILNEGTVSGTNSPEHLTEEETLLLLSDSFGSQFCWGGSLFQSGICLPILSTCALAPYSPRATALHA